MFLCACTVLSNAQSANNQSLVVKSDRSSGSLSDSLELNGNVSIEYGTIKIEADRVEIRSSDTDSLQFFAYRGDTQPIRVEINSSERAQRIDAESDRLTFEGSTGDLHFIGNAQIKREMHVISAHEILYNIETRELEAKRDPAGPQVHLQLEVGLQSKQNDNGVGKTDFD